MSAIAAPRLVVAALRGGSGKTVLTLGLIAAWRRRGHKVLAFKKGPDYIDAAWHTRAAGCPCRNLDTFMMGRDTAAASFWTHARPDAIAVVEGNRGLFDGADVQGTHSTAELAKLLRAPVVIVVDCYKATRTIAASVLGCQKLDPELDIAGVVLNRVAGKRHESVIRGAIASACGLPVFGAIPKDSVLDLPERHLGLLPPQEHDFVERVVGQAAALAEAHLDLDALLASGRAAPAADSSQTPPLETLAIRSAPTVRIAVMRDSAFQFYYPENLEALQREGAEIVEVSALHDDALPNVDGLYIGGGFPETHAAQLAANRSFADSVCAAIEAGLPVMAECAGLMYLGESITWQGQTHRMAGALPLRFDMATRPHGHGYTVIRADADNPFFPVGAVLRGHEFHYSLPQQPLGGRVRTAFHVERGHGLDGARDGVVHRNVLATYSHIHALSVANWATAFLTATSKR